MIKGIQPAASDMIDDPMDIDPQYLEEDPLGVDENVYGFVCKVIY